MAEPAPSPGPLVVGLTGGIGSGKSTVADLLVERGAALVDTDRIAHELTAPGGAAIEAIRASFGDDVIVSDGRMDRAAMRARAFSDPQARQRLEAILHPMIRARTDAGVLEAIEAGAPYVLVAVPLLIESGRGAGRWDRILVVDCPPSVQIERVMQRSRLPLEQVEAILAAQASREARLAAADDVIDNSGDLDSLRPQIETIHRRYQEIRRTGLSS